MEFADKRDKRYPNRVHPEDLEAPQKGYKLYKDASLTGFGLRVTSTGVRAFVLDYVHLGRSRRYTIGQFPAWSVDAARTRHQNLSGRLIAGTILRRRSRPDTMSPIFNTSMGNMKPGISISCGNHRSGIISRSFVITFCPPLLGKRSYPISRTPIS